ncbi:MAG TPA: hypothetical protein VG965_04715 [Patescibacteria group bacterium]|nr:hypothetical protein [Patescibacteria group bacterium]
MDTKPASQLNVSEYESHKNEYDASTFTHDPFIDFEDNEWGKIATWTPPTTKYIGRELQIEDGKQIPVSESDRFRILVLRDGKATIILEDKVGEMKRIPMEYATGFRIHSGQKYGVETEGKTRIIEGSEKNSSPASDKNKFVAEAHVAVDYSKPWGNEPIFSRKSENDPIGMKILHLDQDGWLSLQAHAVKVESYYMSYGECTMVMENQKRELEEFPLEYDYGYTTKVGQRHRHKGKTEMDVFEVSTPEDGSTTWRIEDKYARGDQTDEVRKEERGKYLGDD